MSDQQDRPPKNLPTNWDAADTAEMDGERRQRSSERRRAARIPFIAAVKQRVGDELRLGLVLNIGLGGLGLRSAPGELLPARTTIQLAFDLPDGGELVQIAGTVMFSKEYGAFATSGIKFENITPAIRRRIKAMIGDERSVLVAV